ncbi:FHA domain-containing protein [Trichlorobacter sp.]|uniref:FHA domain-containing protein n=1 Tax=Trichlorobacter sp. TaxID=2911007 RepID=UPI00263761E5
MQQINEAEKHAMIALNRDKAFNFYFFKDGKCAQVYYADLAFQRPEGMTLDEEMLLYAYQPGETILTWIYRDMNTSMSEDSNQYDKESLYSLLTMGYLKNKRRDDQAASRQTETGDNLCAASPPPTETKVPRVILCIESGPLIGARFSVVLPCTIGRKECDFILEDRLISRRHAVLKSSGDTIIIEDLESKNGTKVNGTKITSSPLTPFDLVAIGPINLKVLTE